MTVLALDQSTTHTGWAVIAGTDLIASGVIVATKRGAVIPRIKYTGRKIKSLVRLYKPDMIVYEDVAMRKNIRTVINLARVQGCIIQTSADTSKECCSMAPTEWRRMLGFCQGSKIKDIDLKKQAIDYIGNHFGLKAGADEAEAICIGIAYLRKVALEGAYSEDMEDDDE